MLSIKQLSIDELKPLYESRLKEDFPPNELRPYDSIIQLLKQDRYITLAYKAEEIMAYAFFIKRPENNTVLLDYYAVSKDSRGTGIGGEFISRFHEIFTPMGVDHILIEVECLKTAKNQEEADVRSRRIHFYEKNGCRMSHVRSWVFGVDYSIMYLPFDSKVREDRMLSDELEGMYRVIVPPLLKKGVDFDSVVKFWIEDEV